MINVSLACLIILEYDSNLDPGISSEFSIAAMRVGHSIVPRGVVLRTEQCSSISPLPPAYGQSAGEPALRLCNTYWQLQVTCLTLLTDIHEIPSVTAIYIPAIVIICITRFLTFHILFDRNKLLQNSVKQRKYNQIRKSLIISLEN